ncbi:PREDICTED: 2-hydroxyacylsphingosine 1-beta-galactosyltransferase-like [Papilio polytes]|uniref:2-hydroxyacylsphingosine 1-beta-galactosyltransferase-like n=1 Tax=Papilio polytes TaxID=76194 RepID=UPI000675E105|nr:PREDICTED: 2-hydroxyacylsphingosine 1-beta-galactosyltransferase-like [Papilio polytes]
MNIIRFLIIVILYSIIPYCDVHKILVITHLPIKSHAILSHALVKLLLEAGHEITHIAMFPFNYSHPNLHVIDASWNEKYIRGNELEFYSQVSSKIFTATLQHKDVDNLFRDTTKRFDLIIAEWMFNDICIGVAALYDCPLIWFSASECHWSMLQMIEESTNTYKMGSTSKSIESFETATLTKEAYLRSLDKESFNKIFEPLMALRGKTLRPYVESMHYSSLVLVYSRVLFGDATRWPDNFKPVAGYHINQEIKPLPKDLKSIMDNAKHGVIYFSLGSHLKSIDLPDEFKQEFIHMLQKLKQTVLWKYETEYPELPNNIHIMKWAPQQSILAHPNCVLFITQGGILSLTEAIYYSVPIIGIPIFADQFTNIERAVKEGYGKQVDMSSEMTVKSIKVTIDEMLHNPSYRTKVRQLSSIYYNRTVPPSVEILHWVNQAIRTGVPRRYETFTFRRFYKNLYLFLYQYLFLMIFITFIIMWLLGLLFFLMASLCTTEKILVLSPVAIKSHDILNHALVNVLLEGGYEVTHITVTPRKKLHPNLRQIDVSSNTKVANRINYKSAINSPNGIENDRHFIHFVTKMFTKVLQHSETNKLLTDTTERFDLIISEWLFNDMYTGLAALYDCPLIWFFTTEPHWMLLRTIDKDSATPNLVKDIYERGAFKKVFGPLMAQRGKAFRSYEDMMSIASLVLMNSHQGLSKAQVWPEKFIPVAGYHIDEDIKPLPNDLKVIMDNAKFGVIYFSLGSYLDGNDIPEEEMDDLIDMFGELKQTVIWNLDLTFVRLPSNIHVVNWAPQQSILAHPNCILFITHGGVISKIEAVHFGVPTIGIPVYGDQFANVESSVIKGISIKVDISEYLARNIKNAIVEMLSVPSYRQNVRKVSSTFHNRTMSPKEELLHWVNQTIRSGVPEVLKPGQAAVFKEIFVSILVIMLILSTIFGKQILEGSQKYKIL